MTKRIHLIAAARPNFMKIAPLYHALDKVHWVNQMIIHTGQHYDLNMSGDIMRDLGLPIPHIHLGIGSGTHAEQVGQVMMAYEKIILAEPPDLVVVVGDVNSTMATALTSIKAGIKVAHLEAGLRSFDRTMPEEINRVVTDAIADILWTPSGDADENLRREGITTEKIVRVGNIMIDSLEYMRGKITGDDTMQRLRLNKGHYGVVTLHRPSNVDNREKLEFICRVMADISAQAPLVFPIHPRTRKQLEKWHLIKILDDSECITITEPLNYIAFMNLIFNCRLAITDSGGIQEETTYLGIPCFTLRSNTERPVTIKLGTNQLCEPENLGSRVMETLNNMEIKHTIPELWDGKTSGRIIKSIQDFLI